MPNAPLHAANPPTAASLPAVTDDTFDALLAASPTPLVVEFGAAWCPPCRAIEPHLAALAAAFAGRVRFAACDVDASPGLAARFDVRAMPTLLLLRGGRVVGQLVGAAPRPRLQALVESALR